MCGIVGFINPDRTKYTGGTIKAVFEQLLWFDTLRGPDSTGVVLKDYQGIAMHKRALQTPDFFGSDGYHKRLRGRIDNAHFAIGHNRAATRGNVADYNAHPFIDRHISLVHNGFISNFKRLEPSGVTFDVDSMAAAHVIAEYGEKEGLEKIEDGSHFVLVWHNAKDNTINVARNDKRQLWAMYVHGTNSMFFASEWEMLGAIMNRNGLKMDGKFKLFPAMTHIKISVENPRESTRSPFVSPQSPHVATTTGSQWGNIPTSMTTVTPIGASSPLARGALPAGDFEIERTLAEFKRMAATHGKSSSIPTTRKHVRRLVEKLGTMGLRLGQPMLIHPESWDKYDNQKDRGVIKASKRSDMQVVVEVPNVAKSVFHEMRKHAGVNVRIVNVRKSKTAKQILVGIINDPRVLAVPVDKKPASSGPIMPVSEVKTFVPGPSGELIPLERWAVLSDDGCASCTAPLNPSFAHKYTWLGPKTCLCDDCSTNPDVMVSCGLAHPSVVQGGD